MKNLFILIILSCSINVFSQEKQPKFRTYSDYGYYNSSYKPASKNGSYLSAGFGYKTNKDFWLDLSIIKITSAGHDYTNPPIFLNNKTTYTNTMLVPSITKDWEIYTKFLLSGTLGGAVYFERILSTRVHYNTNGIEAMEYIDEGEPFYPALLAQLALKYAIAPKLYLNINIKSYLSLHGEIDNYMLGIGIEMRF